MVQRLCSAAASWYDSFVAPCLFGGFGSPSPWYTFVAQRLAQQFFVVHLRGKAAWGSNGCVVERLCGSAAWWYDSFVAQRGA